MSNTNVVQFRDYTSLFSVAERESALAALRQRGFVSVDREFSDDGRDEYLIYCLKSRAFPMAIGKDRGEFYLISLWNNAVWASSRNLTHVLDAIPTHSTKETAG